MNTYELAATLSGFNSLGYNVVTEGGCVVLKPKFEPKDGDFLVDKRYANEGIGIFIMCGEFNDGETVDQYACIGYDGEIEIGSCNSDYWDCSEDIKNRDRAIRYATEEEKIRFLERIENETLLRWDVDYKEFNSISYLETLKNLEPVMI